MPRPCIGTAAELWGLLHTFLVNNDSDDKANLETVKREQHITISEEVCAEIVQPKCMRDNYLTPILRSIFQKICRRRGPDEVFFDDEYRASRYSHDEEKMKMGQYMVPHMIKYGQFPHNNKVCAYFKLDDISMDMVSLSYLQIVWSLFVIHAEFVMPLPTGTGMEIYFILTIVTMDKQLLSTPLCRGDSRTDASACALDQIYDRMYSSPDYFYFRNDRLYWTSSFLKGRIWSALSVAKYLKSKQDLEMIDQLTNKRNLFIDVVEHIKDCYSDRFEQWRPFQYWRDTRTGLWHVSKLPL
jgi:hypothetical protein